MNTKQAMEAVGHARRAKTARLVCSSPICPKCNAARLLPAVTGFNEPYRKCSNCGYNTLPHWDLGDDHHPPCQIVEK
jgi:uncharacterized protein (DUF983 family)